jgi:hypothetical protein
MSYESPITTYHTSVHAKFAEQMEGMILDHVVECGVTVDKDELVKALAYDRDQYNKGFEAGRAWVDAKIYSAYKALLDGFTDDALGYLGELLDDHKEATDE